MLQLSAEIRDEFNRALVEDLAGYFAPKLQAFEDEYGTLLFRGPIPQDPDHIGTHVSVYLEEAAKRALDEAEPERRAQMIANLVCNLAGQIRATYDPGFVGAYAKRFTGELAAA